MDAVRRGQPQQPQPEMTQDEYIVDEDPLLIAQSLTYVTDDGSVVLSFQSAPFSWSFKLRFILLETIFCLLLVAAVPIGAHGTVVAISIVNLFAVGAFWYNMVRSVDITTDGGLRFWIGNIEIDVPFDKIISLRRIGGGTCSALSMWPYRGMMTSPTDAVAIVTTVPSTPFFMWPRSAGKPDRSCCFDLLRCPRLTVVFSPAGGALSFIREVENEMRNSRGRGAATQQAIQPPAFDSPNHPTMTSPQPNQDLLDV
eukprot:CAMPEP_0195289012 /NCGR_PEP_ID=MMETSP0707-20130614/5466_1 /TAXON_ID=33640 /ORGANISM="Asterionellopsis glacialis, Strain CCMP134" /LENGTH=254 /DNA_ID=CAMNT_0040348965 /DNA_START=94 /DNA_END=858 /DNA_ORIENTATION=+